METFFYFVECAGCTAVEKVSMPWDKRVLVAPDMWAESKTVKPTKTGDVITTSFHCLVCWHNRMVRVPTGVE